MECMNCPHPKSQHFVRKDESATGCMLCVCHIFVPEVTEGVAVTGDMKSAEVDTAEDAPVVVKKKVDAKEDAG